MLIYRCCILAWLLPATAIMAQVGSRLDGIEAHLKLRSPFVQIGQPVWVTFLIENSGDEAVTVSVPGLEPQIPSPEMGLPLSHVFSGGESSGVIVETSSGRTWDHPVTYRPPSKAPIVTFAAHSMIGTTLDMRELYPGLRSPGVYRMSWNPYGGAVRSETVTVEIAPLKQAEITTDFGKLTINFFYEDAPNHVSNFIELAQSGFYDGIMFHRVEPGYALIGGCPRGDGTGIRADGKRIPAEFNSRPHKKGTMSMALLGDDPSSASCQFFISNTRQKDWDGRYTVFGELVGEESFATLDTLMATPVDDSGRPERPLHMRSVRIINAPYDPSGAIR